MEKKITIKKNVFYNEKEALIIALKKIFSNPPSSHGYKKDIEVCLNELYIEEETYFDMIIECLSKETRKSEELNLITSYLFFMQEFIKLLNDKESSKKQTQLLNELLNLSVSLYYLKMPKNIVLMKFGEKGSRAYINLNGVVDILIKASKSVIATEKEYLCYLARLVKYNEFALINLIINENFFNFPLVIYDDIESKTQINLVIANINNRKGKKFITFIKGINNEIKKIRLNANSLNNKEEIKLKLKRQKSVINPSIFMQYFSVGNDDLLRSSKFKTNNLNNSFKLNLKNEELKSKIEPYIISSKQLLDLFDLKYLTKNDEELNHCSTEEYINRINIDSHKVEKKDQKENEEKEENEENNMNKSNNSNDSYLEFKAYYYTKVISLGKGHLFGELALRHPQSVRTATIITSTECHFSYLNKSTFNNCLKSNTEIHLKQQLSFFLNLPIFKDIPITSFYKKYYTNISKNYIVKNNFILKQGEKPTKLCLLNKGLYILMTNLNLSDLNELIFYLIKKIKNYKTENSILEYNHYKDISNKLAQNIEDEKKLIRDNNQFKIFYNTESLIKITEIDCPDIIGYDELIGENGLYAFSIQAKTIENIIFTIDYKFYTNLYNKNTSVKQHHEDLMAVKLDMILKRLYKIRNNTIYSFFNHKTETNISAIISKELENEKNSFTKLKRFLQFKSTKCNFYNKYDESSIIKEMINDKDFLRDKSYCLKDKINKSTERRNIFTAYTSNFFKNSKSKKNYKKLILTKTEFCKKKPKRNFFDLDKYNNKKEKDEKLNKTSYKKILNEELKANENKDKSINLEDNDINKLYILKNNIINYLPIYNLRNRLKNEYSKINYNQNNFIENSNEIKGKKINDSIKCYFEKKFTTSDNIFIKILKKKKQKIKLEKKNINNNTVRKDKDKEKDFIEFVSSDMDKIMNYEKNNSITRNENSNRLYFFKGNKNFSTPKHLKLNLLLLNNKSINFTNTNTLLHKSLQLLTQKNTEENKNIKNDIKEKEINKLKIQSKENIVNNKLNLSKDNYIVQRDIYYKKNLSRMKLFYGLGKK